MPTHETKNFIITPGDRILITGASGFIGSRVVNSLLERGFRNLLCFTRPSSDVEELQRIIYQHGVKGIELVRGNLLSQRDCESACRSVKVILHLAAGTGEKSFPDAFMNSVVTTRNLLEASIQHSQLRRFVLISSFSVYTNRQTSRQLNETSPIEEYPHRRGEAYCYAKVKQEQVLREYAQEFDLKYVVVRPGSVYGPAKSEIVGRVGISTFGPFLHLGGPNTIPFTYVDNCADAIVLAGVIPGVDGEVFNVLDDNLPSSRQFLRLYKKNVKTFKSVYIPHLVSYVLCYLWERYAEWSKGQLPPVFNRSRWNCYWRRTIYSNHKLKSRLGWVPRVPTDQGLSLYFQSCRRDEPCA
jgi:nucleoside-diphosphate-sugar epimerase